MTDTLAHTCMNVPDAEKAVDWYTENFGFEKSWRWEGETSRGTVVSEYVEDSAGHMLQFREVEGVDEFKSGNKWDHVGVMVGDLDETWERIDHHGVVLEPTDNPHSGSRIAFIEDPFGFVIEIFSPFDN